MAPYAYYGLFYRVARDPAASINAAAAAFAAAS